MLGLDAAMAGLIMAPVATAGRKRELRGPVLLDSCLGIGDLVQAWMDSGLTLIEPAWTLETQELALRVSCSNVKFWVQKPILKSFS